MVSFRTILVPIDFSDHSAQALDTAMDLAKHFEGRLHLIHSHPLPVMIAPYEVALPAEVETSVREAAEKHLAEWAERVRKTGLAVATTTTSDAPAEAIADCAEKIGADLIVMGTRGLTGLKHVLLGSVTERTLRIAPCPVLTLKAS